MFRYLQGLTTNAREAGAVGVLAGLSMLGAWLLSMAQMLLPVLLVLVAVMVMDYISGIIKAGMGGKLNSARSWSGVLKKLMYGVTVAVALSADFVIHLVGEQFGLQIPVYAYFGLLVTIWLIINECISILENLSEIGVPMPKFLVKIFQRLRNKVEESGDSAEKSLGEMEQKEKQDENVQ